MAKLDYLIIALAILACFLPSPIHGFGFEIQRGGKRAKGRSGGSNWCYDKPDCKEGAPGSDWEHGYCKNDQRQSPIDIPQQSQLTNGPCPIDFGTTKPNAYEFNDYEIHNLGETLKIEFKADAVADAFFRYPEKNDGKYKLLQIHFHWGETDSGGSEHLIGGKQASAEMHLVHYSAEFEDAHSAMDSRSGDAFAVLGFLLQVDPGETDSFLKPLVDNVFDKVPNLEDSAHVNTPWSLSEVIREQRMAYAYEG